MPLVTPFVRLLSVFLICVALTAAVLPVPLAAQQMAAKPAGDDSVQTVSSNIANGDVVLKIVDVKFDVEIPDTVFRTPSATTTRSQR